MITTTTTCDGCGKVQSRSVRDGIDATANDATATAKAPPMRLRLEVEINHMVSPRRFCADVCDDACARKALAKYVEEWPK